jgi:hypothetical protein
METEKGEFGQELAYDLRQTYAKIVGEHMQDIAEARKAERFYTWFKNLEDLHVIIKHKFKKESDEGDYKILILKVITLANLYPNVWYNQSKEEHAFALIEESLKNIEMFLYDKMNKANMFGSSHYVGGL